MSSVFGYDGGALGAGLIHVFIWGGGGSLGRELGIKDKVWFSLLTMFVFHLSCYMTPTGML